MTIMQKIKGIIMACMLILLLSACTMKQDNSGDKNKDSNSKEPVTLICWTPAHGEVFNRYIKDYEKAHPEVTIVLKSYEWKEYWTKLPLALKAGEEPDLFYQHPDFLAVTLPYSKTYGDEIIKKNELDKMYGGIEAYMENDELYYVPMGLYTSVILYNKNMWDTAGLEEKDVPSDWDTLKERSRQLEVLTDSKEKIVGGFTFAGREKYMVWALNYQQSLPLFKEDSSPNINNKITMDSIKMMKDLDSSISDEEGWLQLVNNKVAMCYATGKDYGLILKLYPQFPLGVMRVPLMEELVPAAASQELELSLGIAKHSDEAKQKAASNFIKEMIRDESFLTDFAKETGAFPARRSLRSSNEVRQDRMIQMLKAYIDKTVYPGPIPAQLQSVYSRIYREVLVDNEQVEDSLLKGQKEAKELISQGDFKSRESLYEFFDEFKYK